MCIQYLESAESFTSITDLLNVRVGLGFLNYASTLKVPGIERVFVKLDLRHGGVENSAVVSIIRMAMVSVMSTSLVKNWTCWVTEKCSANWDGLKVLILGQIISLLLTCTGWSSASLVRNGIYAPMTQTFVMYALYAVVFGSILIYRRKPIKVSWYWYLLIAVVDLEANYVGLKAFQYTSFTSIMLLSCCSIPTVLFLTWQFLRTRYGTNHFAGVAICVAGLVVVLFSDVHSQDRARGGSNVFLGDAIIIIVSIFAAILNVSQEFIVKKTDLVRCHFANCLSSL